MAVCLKTLTFYGCTNGTGTTCTKSAQVLAQVPDAANPDPSNCPGAVVLSKTEYVDFLGGLTAFGWDQAAFEVAFGGVLALFAVGVGVGLIINIIRRGRTL